MLWNALCEFGTAVGKLLAACRTEVSSALTNIRKVCARHVLDDRKVEQTLQATIKKLQEANQSQGSSHSTVT